MTQRPSSLCLALLVATLATIGPAQSPASRPQHDGLEPLIRAPLGDVLPILQRHSPWRQDLDIRDRAAAAAKRGVFEVGNGRVFGYAGRGRTAASLEGIRQLNDGESRGGTLCFDLLVDGADRPLPRQSLRRVRNAPCIVTQDRDARFSVRTLVFAPPGTAMIVQVLAIDNRGSIPANVGLRVRVTPGANPLRVCIDGRSTSPQTCALMPGATRHHVVAIAVLPSRDSTAAADDVPATLDDALEAARRSVASLSHERRATVYDSDHVKLASLFEDWRVRLRTMRCAATGFVHGITGDAPPSLRQNVGALLAMLRLGMFDAATGLLRAQSQALRRLRRIQNNLTDDAADAAASDEVSIASSEDAARFILMTFWHWRATGNRRIVDEQLDLLATCHSHCKAVVDTESSLETAVWVLLATCAGDVLLRPGTTGDLTFERMQSFETRFWNESDGCFRTRCARDGRERGSETAARFAPLWLGWSLATATRHERNLRYGLRSLADDRAREHAGSLARCLVALSERPPSGVRADRWGETLRRALTRAEPAGIWSDDIASLATTCLQTNGVMLDALAFALTGIRQMASPGWDREQIRIAPRLPDDVDRFTVRGHEKDGRRIDLDVRRARVSGRGPLRQHGLRFDLQLAERSPPPPHGYWDVVARCGDILFVRYLGPRDGDPRFVRVHETAPLDTDQSRR